MPRIFNQHQIKELIANTPLGITFPIIYRKNEDKTFSTSENKINPVILAIIALYESNYNLYGELLHAIKYVFVDDNAWGSYEVYLDRKKLTLETKKIIEQATKEKPSEIDLVEVDLNDEIIDGYSICASIKLE